MKVKIKKLKGSDFNAALTLYAETLRYDKFYCKMFKTPDCYADIKKYFYNDIWSTVQYGHALGAFAGKQLIGVLLGFDLNLWYNSYRREFDHVFYCYDEGSQYWYNVLSSFVKGTNMHTMYIYGVGVDEQFRRKHIATNMIERTVDMYEKKYVILSDISNTDALPMWKTNGFEFRKIGNENEEVTLVVRE